VTWKGGNLTRKICFAGAYGIRSQGDDAALVALIKELRHRIGSFEGVVIARHASEDHYSRYGLRSVQNMEYDSKAESEGKWFRGFNPSDEKEDLCMLQNELATSDLLVLGAGNFLIDYSIDLLKGPIPYLLLLTLMAKMGNTPVMWFGVSVGPLRTKLGRDLTKLAADFANRITVRDKRSINELKGLGFDGHICRLPDPVIGIIPPSGEVAAGLPSFRKAHSLSERVITISVRGLPDEEGLKFKEYISGFADACDRIIDKYDAALLFVPQCTYSHGELQENDINTSKLITDKMRHTGRAVISEEDLSVEQCVSVYGGSFGSICTRLHANVYAAIQSVPPVAISYNPKVSEFMSWLDCNELVIDLEDFSPDGIIEKLEKSIIKRSEFREKIDKRIEEGRSHVVQYADIIMELIDAEN
jgi:colanic acid/amylovoran biosynthesis protein